MDLEEVQYRHLLSTNDEPSSTEILEIQRVVEEHETTIAKLDAEIVAIRDKLVSLAVYRTQKQAALTGFRCVLAPIRRLPPEILATIFLFTRSWGHELLLAEGPLVSHGVGPDPGRSPLRITHVCSKWRSIAVGMPKLWATITAFEKQPDLTITNTDPARDIRLQTWLARTGTVHPLNITFISQSRNDQDATPLSWMEPYMHRIKDLSLTGCFKASAEQSFPILERLVISDLKIGSSWKTASFPSLRRLGICGRIYRYPRFVPWRQLTALQLNVESVTQMSGCFQMLSRCSALVNLEVAVDNFEWPEHITATSAAVNDRIKLSHLIFLKIAGSGNWVDIASAILPSLTLPSLVTMNIEYDTWSGDVYQALQFRSLFPLRSLTLSSIRPMTTSAFIALLRETPSLIEVTSFGAIALVPELVACLKPTTPRRAPELAPNLEYLAFLHPNISNRGSVVDDETILDMIASRDQSGKPAFCEASSPGVCVFRSHFPRRRSTCTSHRAWGDARERVGTDVHIYF